MACDKRRKRHPENCDEQLFEAPCACGKVFSRCGKHEGQEGANRSRGSHRAISLQPEVCKRPVTP